MARKPDSAPVQDPREQPYPFGLTNRLLGGLVEITRIAAAEQARAVTAEESLVKAKLDKLTGLGNRNVLEETFEGLKQDTHQREQDTHSPAQDDHFLLVVDVDHFKQVNDRFGHNAGDRALVTVADKLTALTRKRDEVVRWGGEEFAIMLPHTSAKGAIMVAEKLRKGIAKTNVEGVGSVTVSVGLSRVVLSEDLEQNIERSDAALIAAKNWGRNQVVEWIEGMELPGHTPQSN